MISRWFWVSGLNLANRGSMSVIARARETVLIRGSSAVRGCPWEEA